MAAQSPIALETSVGARLYATFQKDPVSVLAAVVLLIGVAVYEPSTAISTIVGLGLLFACVRVYLYYREKQEEKAERERSAGVQGKKTTDTKTKTKKDYKSHVLRNVWDQDESSLSADAASSLKKAPASDKPFANPYYYAHNNPNATGGYKDGLRMEDYTMNGPRLLSKNGKPVPTTKPEKEDGDDDSGGAQLPSTEIVGQTQSTDSGSDVTGPKPTANVIGLTKYLWDDPGDGKGIATIRIDALPVRKPKSFEMEQVDFHKFEIVDTSATLIGDSGLLVKVQTDKGHYQLNIPKLYGTVADVKTVVKPKRLLVRLFKTKSTVMTTSNSHNLKAWPQPYRK